MSVLTSEPVLDPVYGYWSLYKLPSDVIIPSDTLSDQFKNYRIYKLGINYDPVVKNKFDARKLGIILAAAVGTIGLAAGGIFIAKKKILKSGVSALGGML